MTPNRVTWDKLPAIPHITKVDPGEMYYYQKHDNVLLVCITEWPKCGEYKMNLIDMRTGCRRFDENHSVSTLVDLMNKETYVKLPPGTTITIQTGK